MPLSGSARRGIVDGARAALPSAAFHALRGAATAWRRSRPKPYLRNIWATDHSRNALLSHLTFAFSGTDRVVHTNVLEGRLIAKALRDLRYNVDVVDYDDERRIDYRGYSLAIGFGDPIVAAFDGRNSSLKVITYLAGMHNYVSNLATLERMEDVHKRRGAWLLSSSRFVPKDWTSVCAIADAVIAVGGRAVEESYRRYTSKPVFLVPAQFHSLADYRHVVAAKDWTRARRTFLWFGGGGLVHKGLDLVLEAFAERPDLELNVCGPVHAEPGFEMAFRRELYELPNIHTHGFIDLTGVKFRQLLDQCGWVIFASCSEGGPSSVLDPAANGGLVPIVTTQSSVEIGDFGIPIADTTLEATRVAIRAACQVSPEDLARRSLRCGNYFVTNHAAAKFTESLNAALGRILAEEPSA